MIPSLSPSAEPLFPLPCLLPFSCSPAPCEPGLVNLSPQTRLQCAALTCGFPPQDAALGSVKIYLSDSLSGCMEQKNNQHETSLQRLTKALTHHQHGPQTSQRNGRAATDAFGREDSSTATPADILFPETLTLI